MGNSHVGVGGKKYTDTLENCLKFPQILNMFMPSHSAILLMCVYELCPPPREINIYVHKKN